MPKFILIGVIVIVALALAFSYFQKPQPPKYTGPVEKITIGASPVEALALIFLAHDKGYFTENGLEVELKEYQTGPLALADLFAGKLDVAVSGEYTAVLKSFEREDFKLLASIDSGKFNYIVARKDRGISNPADLKNKKIGVLTKSVLEFNLLQFLLFNNLKSSDVNIVSLKPDEITDQLINGKIDAAVTFQPHTSKIQKTLGNNAITWDVQAETTDYLVLLFAKYDFIQSSQTAIERLLKALHQAEEFIIKNPAEAQALLTKWFNYDQSYLPSVWGQHNFELSLPQSLLLMMEDEARWVIKNKLTDKTKVPNYLDFIYFDALEKVKPEALTIIK